mgnify:CR=1 FL=1
MQGDTLRSGTCPKCSAKEVYSDKDKARHNERGFMKVSPGTGFTVDTYVCIACGHFEEYFKESELRDPKTLGKLKDKWTKI